MLLAKLMKELNCDYFNEEQQDVIDKYKNKEGKLYLYLIFGIIFNSFLGTISSPSIGFNIIATISIVIFSYNIVRYINFKLVRNKEILKELKNIN